MVDDHLEKTKQKLLDRRFTTLAREPKSGIYLFFSFDLVNSTQFKVSHPGSWPLIVTRFYDLVAAEMSTRFTSAMLWKYVGDEVLFYRRIASRSDLHKLLPQASAALNSVVASLHRLEENARSILSVKATVWVAEVEYLPPAPATKSKLSKRNMIMPVSPILDATGRDFLGPDIDTGFRIAKFVERKRLLVSAHLAAILYRERAKCEKIDKKLRIVAYEPLKGVWNGRRYPILWFEEDWNAIDGTFLYDEHFTSPVIAGIKSKGVTSQENELETIERIFRDLGMDSEIDQLLQGLESAPPDAFDPIVEIEIPQSKYSEVHCVAVCFDPNDRILIARRPDTKKRYPSCWEFGCGQLELGDTFSECLKKAYLEDFGAELEIPDQPVPIGTFSIQDIDEHRSIPGIVFAARVKNAEKVEERFLKEKHPEIKWVTADTLFSPSECVPDFAKTLRAADAYFKSERREKPNRMGE